MKTKKSLVHRCKNNPYWEELNIFNILDCVIYDVSKNINFYVTFKNVKVSPQTKKCITLLNNGLVIYD